MAIHSMTDLVEAIIGRPQELVVKCDCGSEITIRLPQVAIPTGATILSAHYDGIRPFDCPDCGAEIDVAAWLGLDKIKAVTNND